jgi:hypothetical protein
MALGFSPTNTMRYLLTAAARAHGLCESSASTFAFVKTTSTGEEATPDSLVFMTYEPPINHPTAAAGSSNT